MIYISLAIGCTVLTFFAVFTCWRGLVVAAIVLGMYRLRLRQARQQKQGEGRSFMRSVQDALYNWLTIKTVAEARQMIVLQKKRICYFKV